MLEKYLNIEGFFEESLKIKSGLKSTGELLLRNCFFWFEKVQGNHSKELIFSSLKSTGESL